MRHTGILIVLGLFTALVTAAITFAGPDSGPATQQTAVSAVEQPAEDAPPKVVTKVYDVREVIPPENYPLPSDLRTLSGAIVTGHFSRGGIFGGWEDSYPPRLAVVSLFTTITTTIDPDSWREPWGSGTVGTITEIPSGIVVSQTEQNHERIQKFFDDLRKGRVGRTVCVQARWVRMTADDVSLIQGQAGVLSEQAAAGLKIVSSTMIRCINAQVVHTAVGNGITRDVDGTGVKNLLAGTMLEICPILMANGEARVDVRSEVSQLLDLPAANGVPSTWPATSRPSKAVEIIRVIDMVSTHVDINQPTTQTAEQPLNVPEPIHYRANLLQTTVDLPLDKWVLVGGMGTKSDQEQQSVDPLYLLIKVTAPGRATTAPAEDARK